MSDVQAAEKCQTCEREIFWEPVQPEAYDDQPALAGATHCWHDHDQRFGAATDYCPLSLDRLHHPEPTDPRSDELAVTDGLLDQAIANMPAGGTYDYIGDVYDVPAGTVAVWQTHPDNPAHPIRDFEVASRLAEDYPEYVTWRFRQQCDVPSCGKWHRPDELCECGLVPDEWAETHLIAQEIRETAPMLRHASNVARLFAIRHNLTVAATAAQEAADEANRLIREMVPDDPHDWPDEAVRRLMNAVRGAGMSIEEAKRS